MASDRSKTYQRSCLRSAPGWHNSTSNTSTDRRRTIGSYTGTRKKALRRTASDCGRLRIQCRRGSGGKPGAGRGSATHISSGARTLAAPGRSGGHPYQGSRTPQRQVLFTFVDSRDVVVGSSHELVRRSESLHTSFDRFLRCPRAKSSKLLRRAIEARRGVAGWRCETRVSMQKASR